MPPEDIHPVLTPIGDAVPAAQYTDALPHGEAQLAVEPDGHAHPASHTDVHAEDESMALEP